MKHSPKPWQPQVLGFTAPWWLSSLLLLEPPHASAFRAAIILALLLGLMTSVWGVGANRSPALKSFCVWFLVGAGAVILASVAWLFRVLTS